MKESACFTLLDFEPPETPTWRQDKLREGNVPSISEMLDYIVEARQRWKKISESNSSDNRIASAVERLEVLFVYHTCQQEDVGIADEDVIRQIIEDWGDGKCRDNSEYHESDAYQETANLYSAYKMLQDLGRKEAESDTELKGLLEVDSYILATHERLMRGLSMKTRGGLFSTEVRRTIAEGELHQYPKFETHDEARDAVLRIVDRYNMLCFSIRDQERQDEKVFVKNILKYTIWLFHELLSLHPFGDGNGRLCRLILNYAVSVIVPFPVPLRDIFRSSRDTYLSAVIAPRKSDGCPADLMRLLVESTYDGWKTFLDDLKDLDVVKSADVFPHSGKQHERQPSQNLISELAKTLTYGCKVAGPECWFWHYMSAINRKYPEMLLHTMVYLSRVLPVLRLYQSSQTIQGHVKPSFQLRKFYLHLWFHVCLGCPTGFFRHIDGA